MVTQSLRYPIYIVSKGRSDCCLTARFLIKDRVPFRIVVEPQEKELYARVFGVERLLILPFSNLGRGSIPARNWIKDHATTAGYDRHWILDDNIRGMWRRYKSMRIRCESRAAFRAAEDFVDRYENVAVAGFNYCMFSPDGVKQPPFALNVHVYSCLLISNGIPHRWRGRYNEDTDLCLQVLADGWCTVLFNAFLILKMTTMTMKGGNTAELYKGDGRLKMARSLERAWPGVVETKRRFQRPQHVVKGAWKNFDTPLKRKPGIDFEAFGSNEYGMELKQLKETKNRAIRRLVSEERKRGQRAS